MGIRMIGNGGVNGPSPDLDPLPCAGRVRQTLDDRHRQELRASGISDEMIEAAGIYSAVDAQIREILGWQPKAHAWGRGMVFPFRVPDEAEPKYRRVKLDYARHRDGKPIKYESPQKTPNRSYFPPGFFEGLSSAERILITEGEKKALATMQAGFPCIGLVGVWGWQNKRLRDDAGRAFGKRTLIKDLKQITWKDRDVVIVFDSDAADNRNIQLAEARLAETLTHLGAEVRVARLPASGDSKVGLDDFLVAHGDAGPAELERVLDAAEPAELPGSMGMMGYAAAFIEDCFTIPAGRTLQWWRDEYYRWNGRCYVTLSDSELTAAIQQWLHRCGGKPTPKFASDVRRSLNPLCWVPFDDEQPCYLRSGYSFLPPFGPEDVIAARNGLIHLPKLVAGDESIHPPTPAVFSMNALDYDFDPNAAKPERWLRFLKQLWDSDDESIATLQEWFGYCLLPDTRLQKMMLIVGPKRSGKGTIVRVLRGIVGEGNVVAPTLAGLGQNFGLSPLIGKTVAIISDARLSRRSDLAVIVERLLSISGEDAQTIDRKYLSLVTTKLTTRFTIVTNELPRFNDASGALVGRMIVLRLVESWFGREDVHLTDTLMAERPGILLWAIEGWRKLWARGSFVQPTSSQELIDDFEELASPVGAFIAERCQTGPDCQVATQVLYDEWCQWCEDKGREKYRGDQAGFGKDLRTVLPKLQKRQPRMDSGRRENIYVGISLV